MEPEGTWAHHHYGEWGKITGYQPGLCTCLAYGYAPVRPVNKLSEIEVIDPLCRHHGGDF